MIGDSSHWRTENSRVRAKKNRVSSQITSFEQSITDIYLLGKRSSIMFTTYGCCTPNEIGRCYFDHIMDNSKWVELWKRVSQFVIARKKHTLSAQAHVWRFSGVLVVNYRRPEDLNVCFIKRIQNPPRRGGWRKPPEYASLETVLRMRAKSTALSLSISNFIAYESTALLGELSIFR